MALTFEYKVRDKSGGLVEGQLDGDSMALVVRRLREMGYMPISVTPKSVVSLKTEIKIPGLSGRIKLHICNQQYSKAESHRPDLGQQHCRSTILKSLETASPRSVNAYHDVFESVLQSSFGVRCLTQCETI